MRYFISVETKQKKEARVFLAAGISAFSLAGAVELFLLTFARFAFILELFGCVLLFAGALLWDAKQMRGAALLFGISFLLRLFLLVIHPNGPFSFLAFLPFYLGVILGIVSVLERYEDLLLKRKNVKLSEWVYRASYTFVRAEVCAWVGVLIAYISDLLLFPAVLFSLWALGVRAWLSGLLFKTPSLSAFPWKKEAEIRSRAQRISS